MRSYTATTLYVCPADKCSFSTPSFWLRAPGHLGAPIAQANYLSVNGSSIVEIKFDKRRFRECMRERSQSSKKLLGPVKAYSVYSDDILSNSKKAYHCLRWLNTRISFNPCQICRLFPNFDIFVSIPPQNIHPTHQPAFPARITPQTNQSFVQENK